MQIKKTDLLAAELEVISDSIQSNYCRDVLKESVERLKDLERIAEFYRVEASRLAEKRNRGEVAKRHEGIE